MRLLMLLIILLIAVEFRAEVHGKPTIIGCYIRGLDHIDTNRCN